MHKTPRENAHSASPAPRWLNGQRCSNPPLDQLLDPPSEKPSCCVEGPLDLLETADSEPPQKVTPELVYREYTQRIYRVALRMVGNEADAEDVTQEVLLQVVRKLDTFRGESSLATWLYRVTANAALALRRKRASCRERQVDGPVNGYAGEG